MKAHEALKQRISMNFNFQPMDKDETKKYIDEKLKLAGANKELLTSEAYNQIIGASNGVPRKINQFMDKALLLMENKKTDIIDELTMMEAIDEITI